VKLFNKWNLGLWRFAAKDVEKRRYPLKGVRLTARNSIATDGRRLVVIDTPDDKPEDFPAVPGFEAKKNGRPFLLGSDGAKTLEKKIPKPSKCRFKPILQNMAMVSKGHSATFAATDLDVNAAPEGTGVWKYTAMQGKFPDWKGVVKHFDTAETQATVELDGSMIAEVLAYLHKFSEERGVTLEVQGPGDALRITAENKSTGQKAFALVMPLSPK